MNNSIKDYHRKPTYDELIQEAIIHPTDTIKYPNRIATQLRNSPQLTRFDDENFLDINILNSNAMKQNLQQTAFRRATQPLPRDIKTGPEQFDIFDTEDAIQQQADDNEAELQDLKAMKTRKDKKFLDIFTTELSKPSQIDDMMTATTATENKRNLRGTSSSSAAAATEYEDTYEDEDEFTEAPPKVRKIVESIELNELEHLAEKHLEQLLTEIQDNLKRGRHTTKDDASFVERFDIQNILKELKTLTTNPSLRKKRRPEAADRIDELKGQLIKILNKSQ